MKFQDVSRKLERTLLKAGQGSSSKIDVPNTKQVSRQRQSRVALEIVRAPAISQEFPRHFAAKLFYPSGCRRQLILKFPDPTWQSTPWLPASSFCRIRRGMPALTRCS